VLTVKMPEFWNPIIVYGWLAFFGMFLGLDATAWLTRNRHIPTFSRVVCRLLPAWIVLPLAAILFIHFALIYLKK
jgi:hypothetical protein